MSMNILMIIIVDDQYIYVDKGTYLLGELLGKENE